MAVTTSQSLVQSHVPFMATSRLDVQGDTRAVIRCCMTCTMLCRPDSFVTGCVTTFTRSCLLVPRSLEGAGDDVGSPWALPRPLRPGPAASRWLWCCRSDDSSARCDEGSHTRSTPDADTNALGATLWFRSSAVLHGPSQGAGTPDVTRSETVARPVFGAESQRSWLVLQAAGDHFARHQQGTLAGGCSSDDRKATCSIFPNDIVRFLFVDLSSSHRSDRDSSASFSRRTQFRPSVSRRFQWTPRITPAGKGDLIGQASRHSSLRRECPVRGSETSIRAWERGTMQS